MTVYVDDMRMTARVGRFNARWSHLMADTREELDDFARRLGLRPSWIQHPGTPKEHYDVTDPVRVKALALGAVPITWKDAGRLFLARQRGEVFVPKS